MLCELISEEADRPRERRGVGKGSGTVERSSSTDEVEVMRVILEVPPHPRKAEVKEMDLGVQFAIPQDGEESEVRGSTYGVGPKGIGDRTTQLLKGCSGYEGGFAAIEGSGQDMGENDELLVAKLEGHMAELFEGGDGASDAVDDSFAIGGRRQVKVSA